MLWIARRVATLAAGADRLPVAHRELGELTARAHRDGARVLLRSRYPVWKTIVDGKMINLRGRLVHPGAPGDVARIVGARIVRDDSTLITGDDHRIGVVRRNPRLMVVVAAR